MPPGENPVSTISSSSRLISPLLAALDPGCIHCSVKEASGSSYGESGFAQTTYLLHPSTVQRNPSFILQD
jgi:hypothetical protein